MQEVQNLTNDASQTVNLVLDDSSILNLSLYFKQSINSWIFDLKRNDFYLYGQRLVCSPNLLRQFKNIIPFGLSIISNDNLDPCLLSDFVNNGTNISTQTFQERRIRIFLLSSTDVNQVESDFYVL